MNIGNIGIVDAHHHIWHQRDVPWLADEPRPRIFGPYEKIRRDYLIEEFKRDVSAFNVVASIYMQANWAPSRSLDEARWVSEVGEESGMPNALVAFADLRSPELGTLLDAYEKLPRVVGVRHQIHWHENSNYAYVSIPNMYDDADWRRGLKELSRRDYPFDLQLFPSQLAGAAKMVREFDGTTFILNHSGMLDSDDPSTVEMWKDGLAELAARPNVYCKLTGLGTFVRFSSADHLRPIIQTAVGLFGADRCIFGSNFPVEGMWTTYGEFCEHFIDALGPRSDAEMRAIFRETALKAYDVSL